MLSVQTNVTALDAAMNVGTAQNEVSETIGQLSSGYRINQASDDAAGLGISESLEANIADYTQAAQNTTDGQSIVQTASTSAFVGDILRVAYGSSKAAVIALTKYVATQYGPQGIRCNAIAPGMIVTETLRNVLHSRLTELAARHVLTPRLGEPEDIAELACFLASDAAGYITGQVISCDGGRLAHQPNVADAREVAAPSG